MWECQELREVLKTGTNYFLYTISVNYYEEYLFEKSQLQYFFAPNLCLLFSRPRVTMAVTADSLIDLRGKQTWGRNHVGIGRN